MRVTSCCDTLLLQSESLQVIASEKKTRTGWFLAGRGAASWMIKPHRLCFCAVDGAIWSEPSPHHRYVTRKQCCCAAASMMSCRLASALNAELHFVVNHCSCLPLYPGASFSPTISKSWKLGLKWKLGTRHHFTTPVLSGLVVPDVPLCSPFCVLSSRRKATQASKEDRLRKMWHRYAWVTGLSSENILSKKASLNHKLHPHF